MCPSAFRAVNLNLVGPVMHYNGLIIFGVANGSSPGLSHIVETKQGQSTLELALQAIKRLPMHTLHAILALFCIRGPSSSSGPRSPIVLGLPSSYVAQLVKVSKLLIVSHGEHFIRVFQFRK